MCRWSWVVRTGETRPERARGTCLQALLWQLHGRVEHLVLEARTPAEDTRDAQTISGQRPRCCDEMTYAFVPARADPLLWGADIVASARASRTGPGNDRDTLTSSAGDPLRSTTCRHANARLPRCGGSPGATSHR